MRGVLNRSFVLPGVFVDEFRRVGRVGGMWSGGLEMTRRKWGIGAGIPTGGPSVSRTLKTLATESRE
jgi:hypothetical protein